MTQREYIVLPAFEGGKLSDYGAYVFFSGVDNDWWSFSRHAPMNPAMTAKAIRRNFQGHKRLETLPANARLRY